MRPQKAGRQASCWGDWMRVPFFILPAALAKAVVRPFRGIGSRATVLFPGLRYDLRLAGSEYGEEEFVLASAFNGLIWAVLAFVLIFLLYFVRGNITSAELEAATASAQGMNTFIGDNSLVMAPPLATLTLLFLFFMRYPRIVAGKISEEVDKDLIYALKDLMVQLSSGVSLYNAMLNVSKSGYGRISEEFAQVVQDMNTGVPQDRALESMAMRTESEFLRRTTWQIVTALKAGASLQNTLSSIMQALKKYQAQNIKSYAQELNLWILIYVVVSVAIPSLGVTLLVILSTFGGIGLNEFFVTFLLAGCLVSELALIEFIKVRRPVLRG